MQISTQNDCLIIILLQMLITFSSVDLASTKINFIKLSLFRSNDHKSFNPCIDIFRITQLTQNK